MQKPLAAPLDATFLPTVRQLSPYQPGKPIAEVARELGLTDIIKLASNENPYGASPKVTAAIQQALPELHLYPDAAAFALRQALAEQCKRSPAEIIVGNGSNELLDLLARAVLQPGDNAVFSEFCFLVYPLATAACGATAKVAKALPSDHPTMPYGHNPDALLQEIDKDTKIIFIANPNNPTGTWWTAPQWQDFLAAVPPQVLVVYDEAYREYVDVADYPQVEAQLAAHPNLIISRSFSKAYGLAALRLGYFLAHPDVVDVLNRLRNPFNVNTLAQVAGIAALSDPLFVAESAAKVRVEREALRAFFQSQGRNVLPSQGNFITVHFAAAAAALHQALLREGIIVRPLANYGLGEFLRVSIGLPAENQRLCAAFEKVWPTLP